MDKKGKKFSSGCKLQGKWIRKGKSTLPAGLWFTPESIPNNMPACGPFPFLSVFPVVLRRLQTTRKMDKKGKKFSSGCKLQGKWIRKGKSTLPAGLWFTPESIPNNMPACGPFPFLSVFPVVLRRLQTTRKMDKKGKKFSSGCKLLPDQISFDKCAI